MKTSVTQLTTTCVMLLLLLACKKNVSSNPGDTGNTGSAKPHTIQGDIFGADGNKFHINNARVTVHVWGPGDIGHDDQMYNIPMDENGHYEMKVADGVYAFHATAYVPLNGKTVCVDLESVDNISPSVQQVSTPGIVKNFGLKLYGLSKFGDASDANSYFGGHAWVGDGAANFTSDGYWTNLAVHYPGATITFILTPEGPCVDGSAAPAKQINLSVEDLQKGKYLVNFPYAYYRLTAVLTTAQGQQKALRLTFVPGATGPHYDYLDLTFQPNEADPDGHPFNPEVVAWEE